MNQQSICFDLNALPKSERFDFWAEVGSRVYRPLPLLKDSHQPFSLQAEIVPLGQLTLCRMTATEQDYERTAAMVRSDGFDHYILTVLEQGTIIHSAGGREQKVTAGDILLLDASETAALRWSFHCELFASIPRDLLPQKSGVSIRTSLLSHQHPHAVLLATHLHSLWQVVERDGVQVTDSLGGGLAALTAAYFSDQGVVECMHDLGDSGDVVLMAQIKAWIDDHLHLSDLDADLVAARFHLSRSSVYRLFRPFGGVMVYIRERRLRLAMHLLRSKRGSCSPLGQLARSLGFPSGSAFSHAFRRRWGVAPRQLQQGVKAAISASQEETESPGSPEIRDVPWQEMNDWCDRYYRHVAAAK